MIKCGIYHDDILVVDRSLNAREGLIVIASLNGGFTVKELSLNPPSLIPHNANVDPIPIKEGDDFELFGVVSGVVRIL